MSQIISVYINLAGNGKRVYTYNRDPGTLSVSLVNIPDEYIYIYTRSGGFLLYIHAGIQPASRGKSYIPGVYICLPTRYFGT